MSASSDSHHLLPTHVCPRCGEWWDVEQGGRDLWFVSAYARDVTVCSTTWTEACCDPICPLDTTTLHCFSIIDS